MKQPDYTRQNIKDALIKLGLTQGDIVFSHSNIAYFGNPEGGVTRENIAEIFIETILEIIGPDGTFVVPTFSYNFPGKKPYHINETKSDCGVLTEMIRQDKRSVRSEDPLFSVAAIGKDAVPLTKDISHICFGPDSFWDRFYQKNGVVLNFNFGAADTYFHFVERSLCLPYRFDKLFFCEVENDGKISYRPTIFTCRDMSSPVWEQDWLGINKMAKIRNVTKEINVGRGYISYAKAQDLYKLIEKTTNKAPFFMTKARNIQDKPPLISLTNRYAHLGSQKWSIKDLIKTVMDLPRDLVSDGLEKTFDLMNEFIPHNRYAFQTGTHLDEYIVPEKWHCEECTIETISGELVYDYAQGSSKLIPYSKSFDGKLTKEQLLQEESSIENMYYLGKFGFSGLQERLSVIDDDTFNVHIQTQFSLGKLYFGDSIIEGETSKTVIIVIDLGERNAVKLAENIKEAVRIYEQLKNNRTKNTYCFAILSSKYFLNYYIKHILNKKYPVEAVYAGAAANGTTVEGRLQTGINHSLFTWKNDDVELISRDRLNDIEEALELCPSS